MVIFYFSLDNVETILLRSDLNGAGANITDFTMESAQLINVGLGAATLVEECQCPPGYEGLSCQVRNRNAQCLWLYILTILKFLVLKCYVIFYRNAPLVTNVKGLDLG